MLNTKVDQAMDVQESVKDQAVTRAIRERNDVRQVQEEQRIELTEAIKNQKAMQEDFGKLLQTNSYSDPKTETLR